MLSDTYYTAWYHPSTLLILPFNPTRDGLESMKFIKDGNGILHGTYHPSKNVRCEVELDSGIGNRPISANVYVKERVVHEIKATWKVWGNGRTMIETIANTSHGQNATYTWTLTEFDVLQAVNPNQFQQADLGALQGARVIDKRNPNNVLINGFPIR
ncbi:hypothetical protein [Bremerella alba]|uniref:Uncharacterized protein n=1 Tax=Bremerella alba TaxID=980252 RepID=A0A7V8V965_9BACT|nr:hypothetical protein [Bremerella alba]MBA2117195.1 hypothetical protein [Bremerella alba]